MILIHFEVGKQRKTQNYIYLMIPLYFLEESLKKYNFYFFFIFQLQNGLKS